MRHTHQRLPAEDRLCPDARGRRARPVLGVLLRPPLQALEAAQRRSLARCRLRADPGRQGIYIEKINGPFPDELKGTPAKSKAGLDCASQGVACPP
jgi:hypothetical protein